jgi:hypothetical protein
LRKFLRKESGYEEYFISEIVPWSDVEAFDCIPDFIRIALRSIDVALKMDIINGNKCLNRGENHGGRKTEIIGSCIEKHREKFWKRIGHEAWRKG